MAAGLEDRATNRGAARTRRVPWLPAVKAALIYFVAAILWFAILEHLVDLYTADPRARVAIKGLTGLGFVIASAITISLIVRRELSKQRKTQIELQESEARLSGLINSAMDGIISVDANERIVLFNPAAERIFGSQAAEVLGQPISRFLSLGLREGSPKPACGTKARRVNGEEFPIEASLSQVEAHGQRFYTLILRDVSDRVRMEEELRQLNSELEERVAQRTAQLEAANRELEAFAYSVSHDLRAPLRHIGGFLELLREDSSSHLSESGQEYLQTIADSSRRMGLLIDGLLDFSRTSEVALAWSRVKMDELVAEVRKETSSDFSGRNIRWDIEPLPEIEGDRTLLKQVWVNLLSNAVKYTRHREQAEIKIRCQKGQGEHWVFSVQDNGAGFDMQFTNKLFGVFQRLHPDSEFEGTGIGLANVRRIISRHSGRVWAEGNPEQGATFFFSLPASQAGH